MDIVIYDIYYIWYIVYNSSFCFSSTTTIIFDIFFLARFSQLVNCCSFCVKNLQPQKEIVRPIWVGIVVAVVVVLVALMLRAPLWFWPTDVGIVSTFFFFFFWRQLKSCRAERPLVSHLSVRCLFVVRCQFGGCLFAVLVLRLFGQIYRCLLICNV